MTQEENPELSGVYYVLYVKDEQCEEGTQEWALGLDEDWSFDDIVLYCAGVLFTEGYDCESEWMIMKIDEATEEFDIIFSSDGFSDITHEEPPPTLN